MGNLTEYQTAEIRHNSGSHHAASHLPRKGGDNRLAATVVVTHEGIT